MARPEAAHGKTALPNLIPSDLHWSSVLPAQATSGSVKATEGIWRASKKDLSPCAASAATCPSCTALCASIGCPIISPITKICPTLVRICLSTVDKQMRTNVGHIFAIGDIIGQPMLAHKAVHEGHV